MWNQVNLVDVHINQVGYEKEDPVLKEINFSIGKGELVGLIGPNGAGKSTTIKSILGLLDNVNGKIIFKNGAHYAYIPEHPIFYDELTLWEHLDLAASVIRRLTCCGFQERFYY